METDVATRRWRGGIWVGWALVRWPFASLAVGREQIDLKALWWHFVFAREDVDCIERASLFPMLWPGLRIRHHIDNRPSNLMFYPMFARVSVVMACLKSLGYKVTQ